MLGEELGCVLRKRWVDVASVMHMGCYPIFQSTSPPGSIWNCARSIVGEAPMSHIGNQAAYQEENRNFYYSL